MTIKEGVKRVSSLNTVQSIAPVFFMCFVVVVFGKVWPQYTETSITTAAVGACIALIGALVLRYAKGVILTKK